MTKKADEKWTTAGGLGCSALEYVDAALKLGGEPDPWAWHADPADPGYFIASHALELCFKAFLRHKGYTVAQLMDLGHNLPNLYKEALNNKLSEIHTASSVDQEVIDWLAHLNQRNGLRYRQAGLYNYPPWCAVMAMTIRLHQSIAVALDIFPAAPHLKFPASWPEDWKAEREDGTARERQILVEFVRSTHTGGT